MGNHGINESMTLCLHVSILCMKVKAIHSMRVPVNPPNLRQMLKPQNYCWGGVQCSSLGLPLFLLCTLFACRWRQYSVWGYLWIRLISGRCWNLWTTAALYSSLCFSRGNCCSAVEQQISLWGNIWSFEKPKAQRSKRPKTNNCCCGITACH